MSSTMSNKKLMLGSILAAAGAIMCLAIAAQAQYNAYDSDSNSGKLGTEDDGERNCFLLLRHPSDDRTFD
jgi:hypothetical protein